MLSGSSPGSKGSRVYPEQGGTVVCVCTVCGETFTAPISDRPFAVTYQVSADGSVRETQRFDTAEEALACAQAHAYEAPGDGAPMLLCPEIDLIGDAVVEDLRIPLGNTLIVGDGGGLTLLGDIRTGSARYDAAGRFSPPGHLVVPVEEGCANRLALGDQVLYDGADPDAGAIVAEPDGRFQWGAHRDNIRIGGGWTDMPDEVTPQLILDGEEGEDAPCPANCYRIQKDLDLRGWVTGIQIGDEDRVHVAARVQVPTVWHWGEGGEFYLCDSGAALLMDAYSVGLAADCNVELRPPAGRADKPIVGLENPERLLAVGGDVILRGEGFVLPELEVRGWDEADETVYTITVEQGATVRLADRTAWLNSTNALVNEGTLELTDRLCLENAVLVNRGTLHIGVRQTDASERPEDSYAIGALELWGAEARLDNEGLLQLDFERFTNSNGDEDGRYGELHLSSGAVLNNGAAAMLDNSGFCYVRGAATLNNQGVLRNRELVRLELGEAGWVSYDGGAETLDQINGPSVLNNTGSFINTGRLEVQGSRLESSGVLSNQGDLWLDPAEDVKLLVYLESVAGEPQTDEDWADFRGFRDAGHWWRRVREERTTRGTVDPALVLGGGSFTNGGVTGVGEGDNGGWANFHMRGGALENRGELLNNGSMGLEDTDYRQSAGAKLSNYNSAGLEFRGGSITVPKGGWFKNEGYMRIVDRYGADYSPCDLEGFPDFFTVWNRDGNDSNWCEFTAEVYDFAGYQQAAEVQRERTETNPASRYNRLDFCADVTVTADTRFADFGSYWINTRSEERWRIWDGAQNTWVELDGPAEGAESYWVQVGNTLTVAKGATLTIAPDNVLRVDGENGMMTACSPNRLVVLGTLVTEPEVEGTEDNDWQRQEEGLVEIWSFGSFDASKGRVDNAGRFEIRYYDMGHGEDADGGFVYVHEGRLERPADCPVLGAPANACYAAEVRSAAGFDNAVSSQTPAFYRLYIREDCCVTLTEDRNVPQGINIEPGSGLIVAHGAALTAGGHIWNDGDLSVYGDLILNGGLDNNQNLEVGALSGSQQGRILLHGSLQIRGHAAFTVYPTGSVLLYDGSEFRNETEDPDRRTRVTLAGQPWYVRGAVLPELECISGVTFENCLFEGPVTVHATADGAYAFVDHCVFRKDVSLDAGDGSRRLQVTFDGNAAFAKGKRVLVRCGADADLERLLENNVDLGGVKGLTVDCAVSAWINPGWIEEDASYVVNGVRVEHHILHGGTVEGGVSLRFEPTDEGIWRVFQVDSADCCEVALRDALEGYDELRLMQGNIDISALETGDAYIHITDPWSYTLVDIGTHAVTLWENQDGDRHGFGVRAAAGAEITVRGACMDWDGQENWYGYTTGVNLSTEARETWLGPHIFGARYGSPAVFIGIDDSAVQYQLEYQGQVLPFTRELLPDGDHGKTHLNPVEGQPWFEAGPDYDPMLVMTITLPEGVRVVFDPVPVKPDWMEPEG